MSDRWLISSFTASSAIHLGLIPVAAFVIHAKPIQRVTVPIELIDVPRVVEPKKAEVPPPRLKPKPQKITAPKFISRPEITETQPRTPVGNTKGTEEPEPIVEAPPPLAALPEKSGSTLAGWNNGSRAAEAEGTAAGTGNPFGKGDVGVVGGSGVEGGGGGKGTSGLGRESKGDGTGGGGAGSGEALSGLARPIGGYQTKPRYPESARRAGAQGLTVLRVRVLENGRVGEVLVERSAGFRDLDFAAAEAVRKWLFEPARRGKEPVAVWVFLPVKFELH
ncbi:MAG: energy transducer TonB [Candidatus Binatia bacterium]